VIFQDLMGLAAAQSGISGGRRIERAVRAAEAWVIRGAEGIGIVAEGFRPYLEANGAEPHRIVRLRNWRQIPDAAEERRAIRERYGWQEDDFICLHGGNMGHKQGLENLIEAARLAASSDNGLRFVLAGDGNRRAELETLAAAHGLSNVQFLPSLDSGEYAAALAAADALLLNQGPDVTDMAFPSKVTSYAFSGRPIVAAVAQQSDVGRELAEAGAALLVEPGQPQQLVQALCCLRADRVLTARLSRAAAAYGRAYLMPETALRQWEAFALQVAGVTETNAAPSQVAA
jgi:glycosyltransferase involved in cell wall biosynthesis